MLLFDKMLPGCAAFIDFRLAADLRSLHDPRTNAVFPSRQSTRNHLGRSGMGRTRDPCGTEAAPSTHLSAASHLSGNNLGTNLFARE